MSNRASLKILAFAASDSPKSSIKIAKYRGEKAYGLLWSQFKVLTAGRLCKST